MNNIYKVIWSKAKNCYVVASEIARSHTKSASGSEKIGGVARHALLALGVACAIACGGFVNVGAAVQRETISPTGTTSNPVLTASNLDDDAHLNTVISVVREDKLVTKDNIAGQLTDYAKASDLSAKADANDVYSKTDAENTFATKTELGSYATRTELDAKANTDLSNLTADGETKIKNIMSADMEKKANKDTVTVLGERVGGVEGKVTTLENTVGNDSRGLVKDVNELKTQGNNLNNALGNKADKTDLKDATDRITANEGKITELQTKTQKIKHDVANDTTSVNGMKVGQQQVDMGGKNLTNVGTINGIDLGRKEDGKYISQDGSIWGNMKKVDTQVETNVKNIETNKTAITNLDTGLKQEVKDRIAEDTALSDRIGTVTEDGNYIKESGTNNVSANLKVLDARAKTNTDAIAKETADREAAIGELAVNGNYIKKDKNVSDNLVELDKQAKANDDAITKTNQRTAGITRDDTKKETSIEGRVTVDTNGNIKAEGTITSNGLDARAGEIKTTGKVSAGDVSTGTLETTGNAKIGGDLTVNGKLNVGEIYMEHKKQESTGEEYDSATSITADGISNNAKVTDKNGVTTESKFTHDKEGSTTYAYQGDAANWKKSTSNVTADGVENVVKDSKGNNNTFTQTSTDTKNILKDQDGNTSTTRQDSKGIYGYAKDKDGNKSYTKQEGNRIAESVIGQDGKETKSEMTSTDITNTAKDGTITNDAKDIVNNATGDMTNNVGGNLSTTVGGNEIHEVKGTKTETVEGKVTENFKNGQETNVTGNQDIHVTGKQTNTVGGGQENIISGGQTNTITGGQINNITGDQTTTITGNKTETVTEDVTEDYKKNLTTTVGGNEIHEVKGTKTETVEGKVTENFKGGQETNVTGNQDIHVTGKQTNKIDGDQENTIGGNQTTTVTGDILNKAKNITNEASNSITDKVGDHTRVLDSDGITDTVGGSTFKQRIDKIMMESKDVSIKAEETLTNEAKVITNKASEVINNEAVNINNTATGIINSKASEIKNQADKLISNKVGENTSEYMEDGKITTSVKDGAKSTVTIQNADGLQTGVTNGTSTNASATTATSSAQTIASGSKANSVITTIDGTQFVNTDAAAPVTGGSGAGTAVNTTIKGNTITTGKVTMDYADVMKDLGVTGKTTTGSLEVKGESKLTGNVTMENNATVGNDLTVKGITTTKTLKVTENAEIDGNATIKGDVTARSYKVGDKTYISAAGINANDQKITNVADGSISEGSKDAVNGGQLYGVKRDLEHQVDKVGANAAAMANLHPMEFDPDSKWNIAAAMGNYGSETATAIGAFYRPNEDVMVNFSTAFGTGENMVGGGVSVRLGKGSNKLSREESNALKDQVNDLTARMDALLSVLNPNMSKDFPDVPENHWAYEAVSRLAGNDIVQGYPDGEFHGERTMTRYEMAEIIYNALSRGAEAERELVEEFKPELQAMAASEKATAERAEG